MKKYLQFDKKRNFSIAIVWINGGSNMDNIGKKGLNNILCSLLVRGCEGFDNLALSDYIESFGADLNHEIYEDVISISIKSLNSHFEKNLPIIDLIINKPVLSERQFKIVKKLTIDSLKKEKENPLIYVMKIGEKLFIKIILMHTIVTAMKRISQIFLIKIF